MEKQTRRTFLRRALGFIGAAVLAKLGYVVPELQAVVAGPSVPGDSASDVQWNDVTGRELQELTSKALAAPVTRQVVNTLKSEGFALGDERISGVRGTAADGQAHAVQLPFQRQRQSVLVVSIEAVLESGATWTGAVVVEGSGVRVITEGATRQVDGKETAKLQKALQHLERDLDAGPVLEGDCSRCCGAAVTFCAMCVAGAVCLCAGACILLCAACGPCYAYDYQCGYCIGSGGTC